MSKVSFNEDTDTLSRHQYAASLKQGRITGALIGSGIVKTESQATIAEIIFVVCSLLLCAYLFLHASAPRPAGIKEERLAAWMKEGHVGVPPDSFMPVK